MLRRALDGVGGFRHNAAYGNGARAAGGGMMSGTLAAAQGQVLFLADEVPLQQVAYIAQAFFAIVAGLVAFLGVPLALRQLLNLRHELRRYDTDYLRRRDAEANLNISADFSISSAARVTSPAATDAAYLDPDASAVRRQQGKEVKSAVAAQPTPAAEPGKRVLRLDLTLENVGEGTVDVLACLVAARELERQGEDVISGGRDAQWDDLTKHYWDAADDTLSPGLSTTKHTVYAQDALARVKAKSRKTLARIDQMREYPGVPDVYLLYRVFVAARRSMRDPDGVRDWMALQRALLNVNAPAFRAAAHEHDPLGYAATPDGWRLFLHHFEGLADPKLPLLRAAADREELALKDPAERARAAVQHAEELRTYCERTLLPGWRRFRDDYDRMVQSPEGFAALLHQGSFRGRERAMARAFPWTEQELWTEYFYVTLEEGQ
jgi:hypothetical protein